MDLDPGTVVANRYRISRQLGRGGMGEVFAAENIRTGRPVAVKLLRSDSKTKSSAVARFRREARAAGSINSDHVTQVLDVEEDAEHGIVLVFELLEGESLIDRLKRTGPIPFEELHNIIEQVWIGLADAHKAGIIHRDLKPSNVFLERRPDGTVRVKILDFGISKLPKEMGGETLTEMGQSLGTFSFMPPEQIGKAKTVDHRADVYACGTLIYQALSGQLPYAARNILVMVEMKSKTDARKLADAMGNAVDPRLEAFLARTLARDPMTRFQTALEALTVWRELRPATVQPSSSKPQPNAHRAGTPSDNSVVQKAQKPDLPMAAMETTTDTAATIAMPLSHLTNQAAAAHLADQHGAIAAIARSQTPLPNRLQAASAGNAAPALQPPQQPPRPMGPLQRTMPMGSNAVEMAAEASRSAQQQQQQQREAPSPPQQYSGPQAAANVAPAQQGQQPNMYRPTPASGVQLANLPRIYEDSTSQPPSQEKTRVYKPVQHTPPAGTPMATRAMDPSMTGGFPGQPLQRRRSAVPFILGAIAFALVGFGLVAAFLQYWKTGGF